VVILEYPWGRAVFSLKDGSEPWIKIFIGIIGSITMAGLA
jgi:hypothetical protein